MYIVHYLARPSTSLTLFPYALPSQVKARHLVEPDQGEFIQQTERLLSEAKKIRRSSSSTLASKEERESGQGKAELPSESASKPFPVAVVTAEDAKPLLGPTPEPPPSAERTDVKTTASVNKPVDENTSAPQGGVSPPKPDAAPPSSVPPDSAIVSSALVKTEAQATRPASPPKLPESTPAVTTTAGSFTITQESQPKPVQALLSEAVPVSDTRPEAVRASDPRLEVVVVSQAQQQTSPFSQELQLYRPLEPLRARKSLAWHRAWRRSQLFLPRRIFWLHNPFHPHC